MKVGIIGGGFGTSVQAPIINTHPKMKVTAVSTMKRHRLPEELLNWENPPNHYKYWTEMLETEELDLLFVSSIPIYHFEMVKEALMRGINVVCEKPFTMNSSESKELLILSKCSNAKVLIDFEWRYLPIRQKLKELIVKDSIGKIIHFEYHIFSPQYQNLLTSKRGWMGDKQKFGGMLGALGTHMIDCLRWLVRDEINIINGLLHTHVPEGAGERRDADDAFFIHGKMNNNATFSIQLLSGINHGFGSQLKVFGDKGTITLKNDKELFIGKINGPLKELKFQFKGEIPLQLLKKARAYYPAFYPFLEKAYDYFVFDKRDEDLPVIEDGHQNQIVIDKILDI